MNNPTPLVSIIIPVYNTERLVKEAIDSALMQTYKNIEVIVINDGSTDNSLSVIESISDPRFKFFNQLNQGACVARNRGIQESRGEYLKFLDADDILHPDCIENHIKHYRKLKENEISIGKYIYINTFKKEAIRREIKLNQFNALNKRNEIATQVGSMMTSSELYPRKAIFQILGWDVKLSYGQEEDLNLRLASMNYKFRFDDFFTYNYRQIQPNCITTKERDFYTLLYQYHKRIQLKLFSNTELANWSIQQAFFPYFTPTKQACHFFYKEAKKNRPDIHSVKLNGSTTIGIIIFYLSYLFPVYYLRQISYRFIESKFNRYINKLFRHANPSHIFRNL